MPFRPQREYRSEEAGQTCNQGLDPVADRERLSYSTSLGSFYYTYRHTVRYI